MAYRSPPCLVEVPCPRTNTPCGYGTDNLLPTSPIAQSVSIHQLLKVDRILQNIHNPPRYVHNTTPHILEALHHLVLTQR